jgi:hypothetical protein
MISTNKFTVTVFLLTLIYAFTGSCNVAPNPSECKEVRSGRFRIHNDLSGIVTILTRDGKRQAEVAEGSKDTLYMAVRWTNDCQYDLLYLAGDPMISDSLKTYAISHPIKVKILQVEKNYYIYTAEIEGLEPVQKDTAFKIQ